MALFAVPEQEAQICGVAEEVRSLANLLWKALRAYHNFKTISIILSMNVSGNEIIT